MASAWAASAFAPASAGPASAAGGHRAPHARARPRETAAHRRARRRRAEGRRAVFLATVIVELHEHHGSSLPRALARALGLAGDALRGPPKSCASGSAAPAPEPATPEAPPARPPGSWAEPQPAAPQQTRKRPAEELLVDDEPLTPEASEPPGEAWLAARAERWQSPPGSRSRSRSRGSSPPASASSACPEEEWPTVTAAVEPLSQPSALTAPALPFWEWTEPSVRTLRLRGYEGLNLATGLASDFACPAAILGRLRTFGVVRDNCVLNAYQFLLFMTEETGRLRARRGPPENWDPREDHWLTLGLSLLMGRVPFWSVPTFSDRAVRRRL